MRKSKGWLDFKYLENRFHGKKELLTQKKRSQKEKRFAYPSPLYLLAITLFGNIL